MIIFDICGTLYDSNTTMDFCEHRCKNKVQKNILRFSKTFFGKVFHKSLTYFGIDFIRNLHIFSLRNISEEELKKDAISFVNNFLNDKKIIEVHEVLSRYSKDNILLVSATIEPVAYAIALKLGNLKYLSTALEYSDNMCLGKIKEDLLGHKANYFKDKKIELVITDNKSDLNICKISKEVVIVSKNKNIDFWENQKKLNISKIIKVQ